MARTDEPENLTGGGDGPLVAVPIDGGPAVTVEPGDQAVVGRTRQCAIQLKHRQISRAHACIHVADGAWVVVDLDSRNGTFVNDEQIEANQPTRLRDGDAVAFGPLGYRVRIPSAASSGSILTSDHDQYATHASIFLRLRDARDDIRELGWEEFRRRYAPVVVGFARKAGLAPHDAEDVLQEVILGFFRVAPQFEYDPARGRFRSYLKSATLNVIRQRARRKTVDTVGDGWLQEQGEEAESAWEDEWAAQILARALEEARSHFDRTTMEAFELYAQRGVPADVVAERLGISVDSVHQAKSRVLKCVREIAERLREEEG
jgi:RNA polymerase sigma factor (sigma-70 family)